MLKIDLNGIWKLRGNGFECSGKIPGSVYSFLISNHLMEDPFYRDNAMAALELLEHDYEFSRSFIFNKSEEQHPVKLHCDGLDTLCTIKINGIFVANTDNMHRTYEFDISDMLLDGNNEISIVCSSPNKFVADKEKKFHIPAPKDALAGFSHLRKAHCMMGWDWGPRLPDAGIWRGIYLVVENSSRITDVNVLQSHENGKVFLTPLVSQSKDADISISVLTPDNEKFFIAPNATTEILNPQLWWPNGLGKQPLYTVSVSLIEKGKVVDSTTKRIGLRTVKLIREKDKFGESFCHEVNGVRFFAMGGNFIPQDNIISRINIEQTRKLLENCKNCNFNTVRVWGGGYYPDDYFYDICDELGLIVFQDLMFACAMVPLDGNMLQSIACEVTDNLKRIRHHACLAIISGNNEIEAGLKTINNQSLKQWYIDLFEDAIPEIYAQICPEIPYISSSPTTCGHFIEPGDENYGDSHFWQVWHDNKPFTEYKKHYFRYLSEFGFESFPSEKTIEAFTVESDRNAFGRIMEMHQRCNDGNKKILMYLSDTFCYPANFAKLIYASQLLQAEAIKYGTEHLRRNRGRCMGALYWQINDIWPTVSWSSIDYYGRYKALQYFAKRFFSPALLSCDIMTQNDDKSFAEDCCKTSVRLCVTNDSVNTIKGNVIWSLRSADGTILRCAKKEIKVSPLSCMDLERIDLFEIDVFNSYISFELRVNNEILSGGTALFVPPKHFEFKNPELSYEIKDNKITVFADCFAKCIEIYSPDSDFILSDNFFDMNGGCKTVDIVEGRPKTIKLRSVYDIK